MAIGSNFLKIGGISLALILAGCQVQPLYQVETTTDGDLSGLTSAFQALEISDPTTRVDQVVHNELAFALTGGTEPTLPISYKLDLKSKVTVRSVGISDIDFGPAAFFVTVTTDYVLRDLERAAPIAQGFESGTAGYDRVDQEFANVRSEKDATERAAKTAALKLRHAISLALKSSGTI